MQSVSTYFHRSAFPFKRLSPLKPFLLFGKLPLLSEIIFISLLAFHNAGASIYCETKQLVRTRHIYTLFTFALLYYFRYEVFKCFTEFPQEPRFYNSTRVKTLTWDFNINLFWGQVLKSLLSVKVRHTGRTTHVHSDTGNCQISQHI